MSGTAAHGGSGITAPGRSTSSRSPGRHCHARCTAITDPEVTGSGIQTEHWCLDARLRRGGGHDSPEIKLIQNGWFCFTTEDPFWVPSVFFNSWRYTRSSASLKIQLRHQNPSNSIWLLNSICKYCDKELPRHRWGRKRRTLQPLSTDVAVVQWGIREIPARNTLQGPPMR